MPELRTQLPDIRHRSINVVVPVTTEPGGPIWTHPDPGSFNDVHVPPEELSFMREKLAVKRHQLGEWPSTAISGNDILGSVLYSAGIVAGKSGKLAPIPLVLVATVLYFFRFIYEEVVTAIPLNGGSYNVLLNTTSKRVAAFGAALGIISYLATGVTSCVSAANYLGSVVEGVHIVGTSIGLLFVFAVLNFFGITESSRVALVIFTHHVIVLTVLVVVCFIHAVQNTEIFRENMKSPLPRVMFVGDEINSNAFVAIFLGFGSAMLGITGFETSAQFVEEQKPGVFRKTLRNMWGFIAFYNLALVLLALGVMPMSKIYSSRDFVIAEMGEAASGRWLKVWVAVDAFITLSGSVLTSYVGINGLVRRLACDRVLPAFLMTQNQWRKTNHWIIFIFFAVGASLVLILDADTSSIGGVYTYAFLGLMALFSFGCMVLKMKRAEMPRDINAPWWSCIFGFSFVVIAIFANIMGDPKVLMYFAMYLIVFVSIMMGMLERVPILKFILTVLKAVAPSHPSTEKTKQESPMSHVYEDLDSVNLPGDKIHTGARGGRTIAQTLLGINRTPIVFFCKYPNLTTLNKAILYVRKNEQTHNLRIVHVSNDADADGGESGESTLRQFENMVALFDCVYPKLRIDFVCVHGVFEPAVVKWLSEEHDVPINMMFITQPGDKAIHEVSKLGVRVITA